jgi:hypothetical protein
MAARLGPRHGSLSAGRAASRPATVQCAQGALSRQLSVPCTAAASVSSSTKDNEYNRVMQQQMGWGHLSPYEYHFERGLYYHEVAENVICGTQPRNREDVRVLAETQGVTTILNVSPGRVSCPMSAAATSLGVAARAACRSLAMSCHRRTPHAPSASRCCVTSSQHPLRTLGWSPPTCASLPHAAPCHGLAVAAGQGHAVLGRQA